MACVHLQNTWTDEQDDEVVIDRFPFVIGRRSDCDWQLGFPFVSRHHCRFFEREGRVWVQDLDSYNGTFLNEERVADPKPVQDGDRLSLGPVLFQVVIDDRQAETPQ